MTDMNLVQQIAQEFQKTGHAHHQAFIETDGADPEWPLWYADYMQARLNALLGTELTKSEIVYLVVHLDKVYAAESPSEPWPVYYGKYLVETYR